MRDLVDRLRTGFDWDESASNMAASLIQYGDLTDEAADEIEILNSVIRGQEIKFGFESSEYKKRIQTLEEELVDERMIHAACGVIALSDREMELRNELLESRARELRLREVLDRRTEMDEPKHPTYGTLDELLAELRADIARGYYIRIGQQGALNWYAEEFSRLRQDARKDGHDT